MTNRFIRVLFGRDDYPVREGILADLDKAVNSPIKLEEVYYCFGTTNAAELEKRGIKEYHLMNCEPLATFGYDGPQDSQHFGTINWRSNFFRHRYPCIEHALRTADAVIMLDLDTVAVKPLPEDFWERMGKGQEFQCALRQGKKPYASWRKSGCGFVPAGSLQYWRGRRAIEKMLEFYAEHPDHWDPVVLSRLTDWLVPWQSPEHYRDSGLEPFCHVITEGRQTFYPPEQIFISGRKPGLRKFAKIGRLIQPRLT